MVSEPRLISLDQNERDEAEAFNLVAEKFNKTQLKTSDFTFLRYRRATCQQPLFDIYPDRVFSYIGRLFPCVNESKPLEGVRVLDLGGGDGIWSVILAEQGAAVSSVEISPKHVELARERMAIHNLFWDSRVCSAFHFAHDFEPSSFDLILGQAVLHHLTQDLAGVFAGCRQVLRGGGYGLFTEPFSGSPALRRLRERLSWLIPLDSESPDERPLTPDDVALSKSYFTEIELDYADILGKFGRRLLKHQSVESFFQSVDRYLLQRPCLTRLASLVFIAAKK